MCSPLLLRASALLAFAFSIQAATLQPSSEARDDFWVPDGPVYSVVENKGVLYVGGLFDYVGPVSVTGKAFDAVSGLARPQFPSFAGAIKAVLNDNAGGWFIGGRFTAVGGIFITNLVHIDASMMVDTNWTPNPNDAVLALASDGTRLFVGGTFTSISGQSHLNLAALDPLTGAALAWRADCSALTGASVNALAVSKGRLYVGGYFSIINGLEREHICSLDAATGEVNDWYPNGYTGSESGARVDALAISGNTLYVGGTFSSIGGLQTNGPPRNFIAAFDVNTDFGVLSWNPDANGPITSIAVSCDTVYVGGSFTHIGGKARHNIAALDASSGLATSWSADADNDVLSLTLAGNLLYAGGKFNHIGGQPRSSLAALDTAVGNATVWNPKADVGVAGIALSGGTVVTGGALGPGGKLRKNVAAFDLRTGQPIDWSPQVTGGTTNSGALAEGVYALAAFMNTIYLGGPFTEIDGQTRNHLAAVDARTGALLPWNPDVNGTNPRVNGIIEALAVSARTVYFAGRFTEVGGIARTNLAAVNASDGLVTTWDPKPNDKVKTLARRGNTIYVGGLFTHIGGQPRKRLAALNAKGKATGWNPNVSDQVSALSISGSRLFFGGVFSLAGDQPRSRLAGVTLGSPNITPWNPDVHFITPSGERAAAVNALFTSGKTVFFGGSFNQVGGEPRNSLAAVRNDRTATLTAWDPDVDSSVNTLTVARNFVYAGGVFQRVGGGYHPHLAVFPPMGFPTITRQPLQQLVSIGDSVTLEATATGLARLSYQWQFNGTNIPGATTPELTLFNLQPADAGDYVLVVTNALGLVHSRPANMEVIEPLRIVAQPQSQFLSAGAPLILEVVAEGHPAPVYQWRLNGVNIPGAVRSTHIISNAVPQDGGTYDVVVANNTGGIVSDVATVIVASPPLTFSDSMSNAVPLPAVYGLGNGGNAGATNEPGEVHAGKVGGSSVWVSWTAPGDGVAVFSTRGSTFDTLLAIYTNSPFGEVASDEDAGGFQTSRAAFNAAAGTTYFIAVDGFASATGHITLTWTFEAGVPEIARFTTQPFDQSVFVGNDVTFASDVASATPVTYQWFKNCDAIPGATNATLTLTNVTFDDVGNYRVVAVNASSHVTESVTASLEIGPVISAFTHDKLEDLLTAADIEENFKLLRSAKAVRPTAFVPVPAGMIASQTLNNTRARTQSREPLICGTLGGASKWFGLRAKTNGTIVIDTSGSRIDTLLAAYRRARLLALHTNLLACDNDSAPDGLRSVVRFDVTNGQDILVCIDGVNGQQGAVVLNWKLGIAPGVTQAATAPVVAVGENLTLTLDSFVANPSPVFQWLFNGAAIAGATNQTFVLTNAQPAQSGTYSIVLSNFAGAATGVVAQVTVTAPSPAVELVSVANALRVTVAATGTNTLVLESSTNLVDWTPVYTNPPHSRTAVGFPIGNGLRRFFRVRP